MYVLQHVLLLPAPGQFFGIAGSVVCMGIGLERIRLMVFCPEQTERLVYCYLVAYYRGLIAYGVPYLV